MSSQRQWRLIAVPVRKVLNLQVDFTWSYGRSGSRRPPTDVVLIIKPEQGDVAVFEDVFFAFEAVFAGFAGGGDAAEAGEVVVGNDLGLDETFFEIGVDDAGGLRGFPSFLDRPAADFFFAGGEIRHQAEQIVGALDERGNAGVIDAEILEERFCFLGRQVDKFGFNFRADWNVRGVVMGADKFGDLFDERILLGGGEVRLSDVAGEEHGFGGEELEEFHQRDLLGRGGQGVGGLAGIKVWREFLEQGELDDRFFVAGLGVFLRLGDALGDGFEIGQHELGGDNLDVTNRVHFPHGVDDVVVLKTADNLHNGVDFANGGEELVAETFALAGAGDEAGDVDEFDGGRYDDVGLGDGFQDVGALVRNNHDTHVRVDRAERIVGGLRLAGTGEGVEES